MTTTQIVRPGYRHWREVFDETDEFVFIKPLRLHFGDVEQVAPGDPVTPEMKKAFGPGRLKAWWKARVIGTVTYATHLGIEARRKSPIVAVGQGWFEVKLLDGTTRKVRGRKAAERLLGATVSED